MTRFLITLLIMVIFKSHAGTIDVEDDLMHGFVVGQYVLIGQGVNTESTYSGEVSIFIEDNQLKVKRAINGNVILGTAAFESTLNGDTKVLRIRFFENNRSYEETCMWSSDLDNYARITCYLYIPGEKITNPGYEALFIDHSLL